MDVPGKILDYFWGPLQNYVSSEANWIRTWEDNLDDLEKEMSELRGIRKELDKKVKAADRQGNDIKEVPEERLKRAKMYEEEASKMDEKRKMMTKCLCGLPLNIFAASKISKKALEMISDVKSLTALCNQSLTNVISPDSAPLQFVEKPVGLLTGVEWVLKPLKSHIEDEKVQVIGVYGMPGVGKTAIVSQVHNQLPHAMKPDDYIIWVDMPRDSSIKGVQLAIGKQLAVIGDGNQNTASQGELARLISNQLKQSRFVLILDGVQEPLDLTDVGIPPAPNRPTKSKIIVVAQSRSICSLMDADAQVHVKCMDSNLAWNLFESKVGEDAQEAISDNEDIGAHARKLVSKSGGLPMVLIKLGRAMEGKIMEREWESAVDTIDFAPWELVGTEIFSQHLRFSYDNLANDLLRTCLLYCSLYPEGCSIHEEWIIDYCIGEGIIDGINMEEIYSKGYKMLADLKTAHWLETGADPNHVKMHPMVRGLALWMACDMGKKESNWLVRPKAGLAVIPPVEKWRDAERISLMENDISEISDIPDCPSLKTLIMQRNPRLGKICDGFFNLMPQLRVLDVSQNMIKQLPLGIQMVKELRYLDLCATNIESLPGELRELTKLRFLLLAYSRSLKTIPDGVISSLKELQVLYMHVSYGEWRVGSVGSGVDFNELNALKQLTALGITIKSELSLKELVQSRRLANSMRFLDIKGCQGLLTINFPSSDFGSDMKKLELILLSDSDDLKEVVIGGETNVAKARSYLPKLEVLVLSKLTKAKMVYHGGCLNHLRQLYLWHCQETEYLLQCDEVKVEEGHAAVPINAFPNLRKLELVDLPVLKSLSREMTMLIFPSLETLQVTDCRKFKKLEMKAKKMKVITGEKSWWLALDDTPTKATFQHLFIDARVGGMINISS